MSDQSKAKDDENYIESVCRANKKVSLGHYTFEKPGLIVVKELVKLLWLLFFTHN
jgi:hypothetical protein